MIEKDIKSSETTGCLVPTTIEDSILATRLPEIRSALASRGVIVRPL